MRFLPILALLGTATAQSVAKGFNYGNTHTDGSAKTQADFQAEFSRAQNLPGTSGFTSARLYTMIQGGTTNTPIAAIPAAIDTKTTLLLGLWASAGSASFDNEVAALTSAINQYGTAFTDLIVGISVGSEDLYRVSPTGILNKSGAGAQPDELVNYINQVKNAIKNTAASKASVGHVDTWTAWVNGSNNAVISACDWLGMDAYPYFQNTIDNGINVGNATFFEAYDNTVAVAQGKGVWVTETGWPVSGPQENQAVASVQNAETYWKQTGCALFDHINTWWYVLQDAVPDVPSPSFGIIGSDLSSAPMYDLSCPAGSSGSSSASSAASSKTSIASSAASPTKPGTTAATTNTESIVQSPGPETSPASASIKQTSASAPASSAAASSGKSAASTTVTSGASSASAYKPPMTTITSGSLMSESMSGKSTVYQTTWVTITSCEAGCPSSLMTMASAPSGAKSSPAASAYKSATMPGAGSASPSPAASSATTPAAPSGTNCPANLGGEYQYPHLIVPVSSSQPDKAEGTSYNGTISPDMSSIFNFDLPQSYAGKTCSLVFLFPEQKDLKTSSYAFNNKGGISVSELSAPATEQTTYNSKPKAAVAGIGSIPSVMPGNSYVVASHECNAGARQSFEFSSTGGLDLSYFQDYNPSPIGAYITVC